MRPQALFLALACTAGLAACGSGLPAGVDENRLTEAVGSVIGDPATCVILADKASGKVIWRSSSQAVCRTPRQACTRPGTMTVEDLAAAAAKGTTLQTGCESVSWAAGPTARPDVVYAAVMYGERALPGREIALRLENAFQRGGL